MEKCFKLPPQSLASIGRGEKKKVGVGGRGGSSIACVQRCRRVEVHAVRVVVVGGEWGSSYLSMGYLMVLCTKRFMHALSPEQELVFEADRLVPPQVRWD